jgi:hypothetical protein
MENEKCHGLHLKRGICTFSGHFTAFGISLAKSFEFSGLEWPPLLLMGVFYTVEG